MHYCLFDSINTFSENQYNNIRYIDINNQYNNNQYNSIRIYQPKLAHVMNRNSCAATKRLKISQPDSL